MDLYTTTVYSVSTSKHIIRVHHTTVACCLYTTSASHNYLGIFPVVINLSLVLGQDGQLACYVTLEVLLLAVLLSFSLTHSSGDFFLRLLSNKGEKLMNLMNLIQSSVESGISSVSSSFSYVSDTIHTWQYHYV